MKEVVGDDKALDDGKVVDSGCESSVRAFQSDNRDCLVDDDDGENADMEDFTIDVAAETGAWWWRPPNIINVIPIASLELPIVEQTPSSVFMIINLMFLLFK